MDWRGEAVCCRSNSKSRRKKQNKAENGCADRSDLVETRAQQNRPTVKNRPTRQKPITSNDVGDQASEHVRSSGTRANSRLISGYSATRTRWLGNCSVTGATTVHRQWRSVRRQLFVASLSWWSTWLVRSIGLEITAGRSRPSWTRRKVRKPTECFKQTERFTGPRNTNTTDNNVSNLLI